MKVYRQKLQHALDTLVCDKCGITADTDAEGQEFLSYRDVCGYHAKYDLDRVPYADGDLIEIDLCQDCKFELLGQWMRVTKN